MSAGRGSGQKKIPRIQRIDQSASHQAAGPSSGPVYHEPSSSTSQGESEKTIRPRGRVAAQSVSLIPSGLKASALKSNDQRNVELVSNFVKITPMTSGPVFQYRIEFEPEIDSIRLKKELFKAHVMPKFSQQKAMFDGQSDIRSSSGAHEELEILANHPTDTNAKINITVKKVGKVSNQYENLRLYNMNMKEILSKLGFFRVSRDGKYVHSKLEESIGRDNQIYTVKGWKTSANVHEGSVIMMNLEAIHKIMQRQSVLDLMEQIKIRNRPENLQRALDEALAGKLVITKYNNRLYRIERIRMDLNPSKGTFKDRNSGKDITFLEYFKKTYDLEIKVLEQPMLECIPNSLRKGEATEGRECLLVPELCNLAGLTNEQADNFGIKRELIEKSQIHPNERVAQVKSFLNELHQNEDVQRLLGQWGHTYEKELVTIKARVLENQRVGTGNNTIPASWPQANPRTGGFDGQIQKSKIARKPAFKKLVVLISAEDIECENELRRQIESGFERIGCTPDRIEFIQVNGSERRGGRQPACSPNDFLAALRLVPQSTTATMIVFPRQLRKHYDAVKQFASVEAGMITQVLVSKLLTGDQRKAASVALKIGIQVVAKIGGDPWYIDIPFSDLMICGYDTYHDTARGSGSRSFGAFIASMNSRYSRWYSKADAHDRHDELSAHIQENVKLSLKQYQKMNGKFPKSIIMYRDGVGDGQLEHVFKNEIKELKKAIDSVSKGIKLTYICVNKRIGARFYLKTAQGKFDNPQPGTVIDDVVTRPTRYDFYLISQSTSRGTVTPTYYSILHDESGLDSAKHQMMAFKLCFLYYNWTGTVRVPAPCQYAHKLALLCGEHLHAVPSSVLDDRLHFL